MSTTQQHDPMIEELYDYRRQVSDRYHGDLRAIWDHLHASAEALEDAVQQDHAMTTENSKDDEPSSHPQSKPMSDETEYTDPIVDEIHAIRRQIWAEHNGDLQAVFESLQLDAAETDYPIWQGARNKDETKPMTPQNEFADQQNVTASD